MRNMSANFNHIEEFNMYELTQAQMNEVSGSGLEEWVNSFFYTAGYSVGYAAGYFYNNVMIGNGAIDDLANTMGA